MSATAIDGRARFEALLTNQFAFTSREQMIEVSQFDARRPCGGRCIACRRANRFAGKQRIKQYHFAEYRFAADESPQVANCDQAGCWGIDGTRYTRGAGNVMFGSNGKTCQLVAPGVPLSCN